MAQARAIHRQRTSSTTQARQRPATTGLQQNIPLPCQKVKGRQQVSRTIRLRHTAGSALATMSSPAAAADPEKPKLPGAVIVQCLPQLQPVHGKLVHLPTRAEAQAVLTLADAYVLEVPIKAANDILLAIDQVVEKDKSVPQSHLRRFAKNNNLPKYVADRLRLVRPDSTNKLQGQLATLDLNRINGGQTSEAVAKLPKDDDSLFLLVGLTRLVPTDGVSSVLERYSIDSKLFRIRVPVSPPMNPTLAREWSDLYWPTQYRKSTPLGPHPSVVRQGSDATTPFCGYWMAQVKEVAKVGFAAGLGPGIGALIVDSKGANGPEPVAIAADGRYGLKTHGSCTPDNIMNHAVMRAIGLVGRKRMSLLSPARSSPCNSIVLDYPLLPVEQTVFERDTLAAGGYLCTGLDIYLTHEPCVMCAQAILHSRFDKVVFGRRMSKTGAATPERPGALAAGLGYGLFWRPELNWRLLVWEWKDDEPSNGDQGVSPMLHA